jgi:hypothetical protein
MKYDPEMAAWVDAWTASELAKQAAEQAELRVTAPSSDKAATDPFWFEPEPRDMSDGRDMPSYGS